MFLAMIKVYQNTTLPSFLPDIHRLSLIVNDLIRGDELPIEKVFQPTRYPNIDIVPSNLSLGKLESELQPESDSHYYLADKFEALNSGYNFVIIDSPPNLGLTTWSVLAAINKAMFLHFIPGS